MGRLGPRHAALQRGGCKSHERGLGPSRGKPVLWARTGVRPCAGTVADLGSRPDQTALWVSGSSYGPQGPAETCESGQDRQDGPPQASASMNTMGCWNSGSSGPDSDGSWTFVTGALPSLHWDQGQAGGLLSPSQASLKIGAGDKGSPWGLGIGCWLPRGLARADHPPSIITRVLCFFFSRLSWAFWLLLLDKCFLFPSRQGWSRMGGGFREAGQGKPKNLCFPSADSPNPSHRNQTRDPPPPLRVEAWERGRLAFRW